MKGKIKVLLVDDEERFRETTSKLLQKKGFDTTIAGSAEEAINILKKNPQDVVILDIKMDGMDGLEALPEIKNISSDIQVIMLTGHGTKDSALRALVREAFDYLNKPCDIDLLALRINDAYLEAHKGQSIDEKQAQDIMLHIDDYSVISVNATVKSAIEKLIDSYKNIISSPKVLETGHRSLLVSDDQNEIIGILSIMDLIENIRPAYLSAPKPSTADSVQYSSMFWDGLFTSQVKGIGEKKIGDIKSETPPIIDAHINLMEVADLMYRTQQRRVLVRKNGIVVGIIREQELFFEMMNILTKS